VYRIVQELVNNMVKHSEASHGLVQLTKSENTLLIDVEDNGKGMDPDKTKKGDGIGWKNIMSRVEYLKGKLSIDTGSGKGTSIHIEVPMA
jgi:two-component system, NarL family, sensor kinase